MNTVTLTFFFFLIFSKTVTLCCSRVRSDGGGAGCVWTLSHFFRMMLPSGT